MGDQRVPLRHCLLYRGRKQLPLVQSHFKGQIEDISYFDKSLLFIIQLKLIIERMSNILLSTHLGMSYQNVAPHTS